MLMVNYDTENGGMEIDPDFVVDFGKEPNGPSRCHETTTPAATAQRYLAMKTVTLANRGNASYQVSGRRPLLMSFAIRGSTFPMAANMAAASPVRRS